MKVIVDVKNAQATEKTRGSDMVAEGMMEIVQIPRSKIYKKRDIRGCSDARYMWSTWFHWQRSKWQSVPFSAQGAY
jgi:hypothetical protein